MLTVGLPMTFWPERKIWIRYTANRKSSLSIRVILGRKEGGRINEIKYPAGMLRKLALRRLASAQDRDVHPRVTVKKIKGDVCWKKD